MISSQFLCRLLLRRWLLAAAAGLWLLVLAGTAPAQDSFTVATASASVNGGHTLDGNDTLTVTGTGSITVHDEAAGAIDVSGDDNNIVLNAGATVTATNGTLINSPRAVGVDLGSGSGNRLTLEKGAMLNVDDSTFIGVAVRYNGSGGGGTLAGTVGGQLSIVISQNEGNDNVWTISGALSGIPTTSGGRGVFIGPEAGADNRVILLDGAEFTGSRFETTPGGIFDVRLTGSYEVRLQGPWRNPQGNTLLPLRTMFSTRMAAVLAEIEGAPRDA